MIICTNTYRNHDLENRKEAFTQLWAMLISRFEELAVVEFCDDEG